MEKEILDLVPQHFEPEDIDKINLPRTQDFFVNSRGQKLHARLFFPPDISIKYIIVYLHGYSGHINRPEIKVWGEHCIRNQIAFATFDFHGHGYSEGLRALIESQADLFDDVFSFLKELYRPSQISPKIDSPKIDSHMQLLNSKKIGTLSCPFLLMGQSMGGAVDISVSKELYSLQQAYLNRLSNKNIQPEPPSQSFPLESQDPSLSSHSSHSSAASSALSSSHESESHSYSQETNITNETELEHLVYISQFYAGSILLCPMIVVQLPPPFVCWLIESLIVPIFPEFSVPSFLTNLQNKSLLWTDDSFIRYDDLDGYPRNPKGLGFSDNIRFRTGLTMIKYQEHIQSSLSSISFPFLLFHDPDDQIVPFEGTQRLFAECRTPPEDKRLVTLSHGLHDLMSNKATMISNTIFGWAVERISKLSELNLPGNTPGI